MLVESGPKDGLLSFDDIGQDPFLDCIDYNQQPLDAALDDVLYAGFDVSAPSLLEIDGTGCIGSNPLGSQEGLPPIVDQINTDHPRTLGHDGSDVGKSEMYAGTHDPVSEIPEQDINASGWSNDMHARDNANPSSAGSACTSSDESENGRAGSDGSSAVSRVNEQGSVSPAGNSTQESLHAYPGVDTPQSAPLVSSLVGPGAASPLPYGGLAGTAGHAGFYGVAAPPLFAPRILDPRYSMPYIGSLPARRGRRGGQKKMQASPQVGVGADGAAVAAVASPADNSQTTAELQQPVSAELAHGEEQVEATSASAGRHSSQGDTKQTAATSAMAVQQSVTGASGWEHSGGEEGAKVGGAREKGVRAGESKAGGGEAEEGEDEEKRQARLVRNRESAQLSRQRKKVSEKHHTTHPHGKEGCERKCQSPQKATNQTLAWRSNDVAHVPLPII